MCEKAFCESSTSTHCTATRSYRHIILASACQFRALVSDDFMSDQEFSSLDECPKTLEWLLTKDGTELQYEAVLAFENIADVNWYKATWLLNCGAIKKIYELALAADTKLRQASLRALSDIIGASPLWGKFLVEISIVDLILQLGGRESSSQTLRNVSRLIVALCDKLESAPAVETVAKLLPIIRLLINSKDRNILREMAISISSVASLGFRYILEIIGWQGTVIRLIELMIFQDEELQLAAVNALIFILSTLRDQRWLAFECGVLQHACALLKHASDELCEMVLYLLLKILPEIVITNAVISSELIPVMIENLCKIDRAAQVTLMRDISGMLERASNEEMKWMIKLDVIPPLCRLLQTDDLMIIPVVLSSLLEMLGRTEAVNINVMDIIDDCGGLALISPLRSSDNKEIQRLALCICNFPEGESIVSYRSCSSYLSLW